MFLIFILGICGTFPLKAQADPPLPAEDSLRIDFRPLPSVINTPFSEYACRLLPDSTFLFTSMRHDAEEDAEHFFETNWYCNIYESKMYADMQFAPGKALPSGVNHPKYFNSNFCLSEDGRRMILTRCRRVGDGDLHCDLWQTEKSGGNWQKPRRLPATINETGSSTMQPCLVQTPDYEVLYFASDRPGGYGKTDIWYAIRKNGHFQPPVNLGPTINTEGEEVTPFYDPESEVLYFSSDEHRGIGDFDIFCSEGALGRWQPARHLDRPFNSEYNDYYFVINQDGKSAFLSSNRPRGDLADEDTCCNDLFLARWSRPHADTVVPPPPKRDIHEKIASVLPITLYFQNDSPDPKSLSDTTDKDYEELYNAYVNEIQDYIHGSGEGLTGEERRRAMYAVAGFMRDSVQTGYARLLQLKQYLNEAMSDGDTVELVVYGFASPLHNSQYNKHLSSRRIVSLLNWLRKADNGSLSPHIIGASPGIRIRTYPEGAVNHEFETDEVRETVFGLRAAKDRKIIIATPARKAASSQPQKISNG